MGSVYSQPPHGQEQTVAQRAPSQAAFDTSHVSNQPPISSMQLLDVKRSLIQQHGVQKGNGTRVVLPGSWLAEQSPSERRRALRRFLRPGTSFFPHKAGSETMWNVQGSSECDCFHIDGKSICSWVNVCKIITGKRVGACSFSGCHNKATCGGHVKYVDRKAWYLAPICSSCNSVNRDAQERRIKTGTILVKIKCHCPK
jgi:hypothetical protein